MSCNNWGGYFT